MIDYEEDCVLSVIFRWRGSVAMYRSLWFAVPSTAIALALLYAEDYVLGFREEAGLEGVTSSVLWSAMTAGLLFLVGFRSRLGMGRFWEGTGLLHQMRGEWFDAASCLMTFSRSSRASCPREVAEFRHTLVRLMSLMHGSALEEIKANHEDDYEVIDIHGLDPGTRCYLEECKVEHGFNRVEVLLHMVQVLVTQNLDTGVLDIAPPILSRVYQTLSRGLVNLLNARKITDTKFPFPYAQLISVLLILYALFTPVVLTGIVRHKGWAALLSFIPVFATFSLNFIAIELEVPFGDDENDLPLVHFQTEMNKSLLMLLMDQADHLVHTSSTAQRNVKTLRKSMHKSYTSMLTSPERTRGEHIFDSEAEGMGAVTDIISRHSSKKFGIQIEESGVDGLAEGLRQASPMGTGEVAEPPGPPSMSAPKRSGTLALDAFDSGVEEPEVSCDLAEPDRRLVGAPWEPGGAVAEPASPARPARPPASEPAPEPSRGGDKSREGTYDTFEVGELEPKARGDPPDLDRRLVQWSEELSRNTEALTILAAAVPQLAGEPYGPCGARVVAARGQLAGDVSEQRLRDAPHATRCMSDAAPTLSARSQWRVRQSSQHGSAAGLVNFATSPPCFSCGPPARLAADHEPAGAADRFAADSGVSQSELGSEIRAA